MAYIFTREVGVRLIIRVLLLFLWVPFALADGSSSAVNERIPVARAEMEAHWQVDCASAWARVSALRAEAGEQCAIPAGLLREIRLCAFIYQPPGDDVAHTDLDFRSVATGGAGAPPCIPPAQGKK